jgi:hypothetical protein
MSNRFNLENDQKQAELVKTLRKAASDGVDVDAAYGEVQELARKKVWEKGKRKSKKALDLNHLLDKKTDPANPFLPSGYDHGSLWENDEGEVVSFVFQPYDLTLTDLKELVEICESNGLRVKISGKPSWHFAGSTFLVVLSRKSPK